MRTLQTISVVFALAVAACASTPKTVSSQVSLEQRANATLSDMTAKDSSLNDALAKAPGYAVFPSVGKGGLVVGGAGGEGVLYVHGQPDGVVSINEVSIGAQAGGQAFSELIVINDANEIAKIKSGTYSLDANASAVALKSGVAASTDFTKPVTVFTQSQGGLMVEAAVAGQKLSYYPQVR